jgi:hypothetical protein
VPSTANLHATVHFCGNNIYARHRGARWKGLSRACIIAFANKHTYYNAQTTNITRECIRSPSHAAAAQYFICVSFASAWHQSIFVFASRAALFRGVRHAALYCPDATSTCPTSILSWPHALPYLLFALRAESVFRHRQRTSENHVHPQPRFKTISLNRLPY